MKENLVSFLEENLSDLDVDFNNLVEKPKSEDIADFALPVFIFAKKLKKSPQDIAKELSEKLNKNKPDFVLEIVNIGPYINFKINYSYFAKDLANQIYTGKFLDFSKSFSQKILIEYPSPNTNKALHVGHVRNILIGNSLSNLLEKTGFDVIRVNMNNDRGIAVCKSMLGYELFYKNHTPKSLNLSPDEFVSLCYVKFEKAAKKDPSLNEKAQEMLLKWEQNDPEVRALWDKIIDFVFEGYAYTYDKYKLQAFDKEYYESLIYDKGKDIVLDGLKNKVKGFGKEKDGAIYCDLSDVGLDKKYLLRGDGTTLYITQDLYLSKIKQEEFGADKNVFVVGCDQEYHFKVLFELIDRLKIAKKENNYHFSYGYVFNKDGKKFSSRNGDVLSANSLYDWMMEAAKKNLSKKDFSKLLDDSEFERRAKVIAYAALAFSFLKVNPKDNIKFDIDKSLAMVGETGPYILYTIARIQSIIKKANYREDYQVDYSLLGGIELDLIKILLEYPNVVLEAAKKYEISKIAHYLLKLSQKFNEFYQNSNIINEEKSLRKVRLVLVDMVSKVLKDGLWILDIEALDEM